MNIKKKTKRYNFKEEKLESYFNVNVGELTDEQIDYFIRVFSRSVRRRKRAFIPANGL